MANQNPNAPEDKMLEAGLLFDTYGELLTERQRTFMLLHFEEDLSFSDIAREFKITRQAVHDSVKHALTTLTDLENALGVVAKSLNENRESHLSGRQLLDRLISLRKRVDAECPDEYASWISQELHSLIHLLGGEESAPQPIDMVEIDETEIARANV